LNGRSFLSTDAQTKPLLQTHADAVELAEPLEGAEAVKIPERNATSSGGKNVPSLLAQMAEKQPKKTIKSQLSPQEMAEMAEMAAKESEEGMDYRRRQVALSIASPLLGAALFAAKRSAKKDPVATLRAMERRSPPIQVALASGLPTLIEFYAQWCGDCKAMAGHMEELEQEYGNGKVNFVVLDAEKPENAKLVGYFRVDAIPHLAFIDGDKVLQTTLTGYLPKKVMAKQLEAFAARRQLPYCGPDKCGLDPKTTRMEAGSRA